MCFMDKRVKIERKIPNYMKIRGSSVAFIHFAHSVQEAKTKRA